jgi:indole-3-glycerol phosphate synthase
MTILDTIVAHKRTEIARLTEPIPTPSQLAALARDRGGARSFQHALRHPIRSDMALIAEVKKASPSAGLIRPDFDPVAIAQAYEQAGADCLSVLTDERFFQGSLTFLPAIRQKVSLPLLRKDFILDARQIAEAIRWGADAILLIVSILSDSELRQFHDLAFKAGLSVLVEVHDELELDRALAAGAKLIGVNNRNLKDFTVDLGTTERLARRLNSADAHDVLLVAESGIHHHVDVRRLAECGAQAILVGESLMRQADLAAKVRELMEG